MEILPLVILFIRCFQVSGLTEVPLGFERAFSVTNGTMLCVSYKTNSNTQEMLDETIYDW